MYVHCATNAHCVHCTHSFLWSFPVNAWSIFFFIHLKLYVYILQIAFFSFFALTLFAISFLNKKKKRKILLFCCELRWALALSISFPLYDMRLRLSFLPISHIFKHKFSIYNNNLKKKKNDIYVLLHLFVFTCSIWCANTQWCLFVRMCLGIGNVAVDGEPREIQFWIANSKGSSYFSLAVHGQSLFR